MKIYPNNKEQYILEQKVKISGMKSKSAFLRRLILYGFVYNIDYSDLRDYNYSLGKISGNLNQIAKRINAAGNVFKADVAEVKKPMRHLSEIEQHIINLSTKRFLPYANFTTSVTKNHPLRISANTSPPISDITRLQINSPSPLPCTLSALFPR